MKKKNNTIYTPLKEPIIEEKNENTTNSKEVEYEHGYHPNSIKALKKHQYPKGISGNIYGKKPLYENLKRALSKLGDEETFNKYKNNESLGTRKSQVLKRIWMDAIRGDMKAIKLLAYLGALD